MVKLIKANKLASIIIFVVIIFLLVSPSIVMSASLSAVSLWSTKVFPMLFPMFILTRLIVGLSEDSANLFTTKFARLYNTRSSSLQTFVLSAISGYPMGAKLIQTRLNNGDITFSEAYRMLSFCSISGPAFMMGSIGVATLFSLKAGIIITLSNILGALINGLLYRGKRAVYPSSPTLSRHPLKIGDIVYDSIRSILMVAGFMIICFLLIDVLDNLQVFNAVANILNVTLNVEPSITKAILQGLFEITRGASTLATTNASLKIKTIIASGLIAFGGISVLLQTKEMFDNSTITYKKILKQKATQAIITLVITALIVCFV